MSIIKKFEDINAWKKARLLAKEIYIITNYKEISSDYSLKDQIKRSCGSVMDNIAEDFERGGNKEFIQFLYIAKGSNSELRSQLYRAFDQKYILKNEFIEIYNLSIETGKLIGSLIKYLQNTDNKGSKYNKP